MVVGDLATSVDVVVLGGGPGGYVAAIRAAQLGKEVVLISDGPLGGSCLHAGCIPSKALLSAADRVWQAQHSAHMGLQAEAVSVDFERMQQWKAGLISTLSQGVGKLLKRNRVTVVSGKGWFMNDGEVRVEGPHGSLRYMFEHAVIATGASAKPLPELPFDGQRILTPHEALALTHLPRSLTVIGADYIAAELATIFSKLGCSVRLLIPAGRQLLDEFEPTAGRLVQAGLKNLGVSVTHPVTDTELTQTAEGECINAPTLVPKLEFGNESGGTSSATDLSTSPELAEISFDISELTESDSMVVVSAGVQPNSAELNLAQADVITDDRGFILVNTAMQSNVPHIYAIGDVTGGNPRATFAIKQAKVAAESLAGQAAAYEPQALPQVAWTDPEVAAVGLTTAQAEALGYQVQTSRFPLGANGRALTLDGPSGSIIMVAEAENEVLLGVTLIAPRASDLIGEAALAIEMGATITDLAETLHPHPGFSEGLSEVAEMMLGRAVHGI